MTRSTNELETGKQQEDRIETRDSNVEKERSADLWLAKEHQEIIKTLGRKELKAENGEGPKLTPSENVLLPVIDHFPCDTRMQEIGQKVLLGTSTKEESGELMGRIAFPYSAEARAIEAKRWNDEPVSMEELVTLEAEKVFGTDQESKELFFKVFLNSSGDDPEPSIEERADIFARIEFPRNEPMRDLTRREMLAEAGRGQPLKPEEYAVMNSERKFPHNAKYWLLAEQEFLSDTTGSEPLSASDQADLDAYREFPYNTALRKLAIREHLHKNAGGEALSEGEQDYLNSSRQQSVVDPASMKIDRVRQLIERDRLHIAGKGPALTADELEDVGQFLRDVSGAFHNEEPYKGTVAHTPEHVEELISRSTRAFTCSQHTSLANVLTYLHRLDGGSSISGSAGGDDKISRRALANYLRQAYVSHNANNPYFAPDVVNAVRNLERDWNEPEMSILKVREFDQMSKRTLLIGLKASLNHR